MAKAVVLRSNRFTWSKEEPRGSADVSDFRQEFGTRFPQHFYVESSRTGDKRLFLPGDVLYTGEGSDREVAGQQYFCPAGGITVTLFND